MREKLTSGTVLGPLRTGLGVAFSGERLLRATSRFGLSLEAAGSTLRNTAALKHLGYTTYRVWPVAEHLIIKILYLATWARAEMGTNHSMSISWRASEDMPQWTWARWVMGNVP